MTHGIFDAQRKMLPAPNDIEVRILPAGICNFEDLDVFERNMYMASDVSFVHGPIVPRLPALG